MGTSDSQAILDSIRRLVRILRVSDRAAQSGAGLSGAQLFVLQELAKAPAASLNDLAERTHTDQSSVSVVVTRLEEAKLVKRHRSKTDARRTSLTITRRGEAGLRNAPSVAQHQLIDAIAALSPTERKRFAHIFSSIVEAMGAATEPASMLFEEERSSTKAVKKKSSREKK